MLSKSDIDEMIRSYFDLRSATTANEKHNIHRRVVSIIKDYPEYANYFLTHEERIQ
tara:strand:+ start:12 stop:179 length:168 start_codon:yes stop_codon:yes gene_type:complete